jgi:c-di-GMP-binding flagellar brake protein YcgR
MGMEKPVHIIRKHNPGVNIQTDIAGDSLLLVTVNDILQVKIKSDEISGNYYTRVNNIEDGKIVVSWPTYRGIRLPVHRDQILEFFFLRDGIPCVFNALIEHTDPGPFPQVTIIPTSEIIQKQRRDNFRIKCIVPVEIWGSRENSDSKGFTKGIVAIKEVTNDLSASGFSVRYSKPILEGTLLEAKIELPDNGPKIKMPCQVAYCEEVSGRFSLYQIGVRYLNLSERERARIVRYLYRTQLRSL